MWSVLEFIVTKGRFLSTSRHNPSKYSYHSVCHFTATSPGLRLRPELRGPRPETHLGLRPEVGTALSQSWVRHRSLHLTISSPLHHDLLLQLHHRVHGLRLDILLLILNQVLCQSWYIFHRRITLS